MSSTPTPWSAPDSAAPAAGVDGVQPLVHHVPIHGLPPAGPPAAGAMNFAAGVPLGGTVPVAVDAPKRSDRRELALTSVLLVAAIAAGATSLMPWRDVGARFGASAVETGWMRPDGSMGRGWVFVALAVLLAISGVLIAGQRAAAGRVLASLTGSLMVLAAIAEWGLGAGAARTGPGLGLWVELTIGVLVVIAVGVLGPKNDAES